MNPFDALLVPPALVKRAFEDLHDIAQFVRRVAGLEDEFRARVDAVEGDAGCSTRSSGRPSPRSSRSPTSSPTWSCSSTG